MARKNSIEVVSLEGKVIGFYHNTVIDKEMVEIQITYGSQNISIPTGMLHEELHEGDNVSLTLTKNKAKPKNSEYSKRIGNILDEILKI
jgi:hypothetical protein